MRAGLLAVMLLSAACADRQAPSASDPDQSPGTIDIAVGKDVRSFGLQEARCDEVLSGGDSILRVVAPAAHTYQIDGVDTRPDLFTARLPADIGPDKFSFGLDQPDYGAIATVADAEYDDERYPVLQVIAHAARDGATGYECTASRNEEALSVICNRAKVFPWFSPRPEPVGSFKATVFCRTENGN